MRFANDFVLDRWKGAFRESPTITEGEFKEIVGDAEVSYHQGMTQRQAEMQLAEWEFNQWDSQFDQYPFTQFGGMAVPFVYDPGTVITLPVGAKNIAGMATARSLRQFMMQGAIAGGKISPAATAAEGALQLSQTGRLDAEILTASAVATAVLPPVIGGIGRGFRAGFGRIRDPRMTKQVMDASGGRATPEQAAQAADEASARPAPPVRILNSEPHVPTVRLNETFQGYPGGRAQWLRDLSAGRSSAREFAQSINVDPDAPALRDLLITMQDRSAQTSRTPLEHNVRLLDAINLFRGGDRSPEVVGALWQEGLLVARQRGPADVPDIPGRPAPRDTADPLLELSETGRLLDEALKDPSTPANGELLRQVYDDGMGALDRAARQRGVDLDPDTNPRASWHRVAAAEVSDGEIIKALEAAKLQTSDARPRAPTRADTAGAPDEPPVTPARSRDPENVDPDDASQAAKIRELGGDPEQVTTLIRQALDHIDTCGRRT